MRVPATFCGSVLLLLALCAHAAQDKPPSSPSSKKKSAPSTAKKTAAGNVKQPVAKEYKQGETYALKDVVRLNAEGNKLSVELLPPGDKDESKPGSIKVKVKISGPMQVLSFTYGEKNSRITLAVDSEKIPASSARFTDEVVGSVGKPTLVTRFRTSTEKGTLVIDTSEHPLVLLFEIPDALSQSPKQLELDGVGIGDPDYSFKVRLDK